MTLDANRVDHVRNFDFSKIPSGWSWLAERMVRYAALHADSRGVLNINRKTFLLSQSVKRAHNTRQT